jgi:hypothetical protein
MRIVTLSGIARERAPLYGGTVNDLLLSLAMVGLSVACFAIAIAYTEGLERLRRK